MNARTVAAFSYHQYCCDWLAMPSAAIDYIVTAEIGATRRQVSVGYLDALAGTVRGSALLIYSLRELQHGCGSGLIRI